MLPGSAAALLLGLLGYWSAARQGYRGAFCLFPPPGLPGALWRRGRSTKGKKKGAARAEAPVAGTSPKTPASGFSGRSRPASVRRFIIPEEEGRASRSPRARDQFLAAHVCSLCRPSGGTSAVDPLQGQIFTKGRRPGSQLAGCAPVTRPTWV